MAQLSPLGNIVGSSSFNSQWDQHGAWRREFASRLKLLGEWMQAHQLMDAAVEERLRRLEVQMRSDKVMVAFVAEFSRGKSELINAIFFADYGRRIMPAGAGRTTMCPTELGYDAGVPPSLRLLPIDTRLKPHALAEWRLVPERWTHVPLDVHDADQLATALAKVTETRRVTKDDARALGFWHDELPEENPLPDANDLVEIPMWRHALINIAHPLLKQGLVILDTPGLNAIGAEPELTVSLLPQAHGIIFILGADTGVTRSDLSIWRDHLAPEASATDNTRLVVLTKIDTLWDALSTQDLVVSQIERQRETSAAVLGVPASQVIAVSAQKGLVAKVTHDDALLRASALPVLEDILGKGVMGQRQDILQSAVASGIAGLRTETGRVLNMRRRDLDDQMLELRSLRGKNASVINQHAWPYRAGAVGIRRQCRAYPCGALGACQAAERRVPDAGQHGAESRDGGLVRSLAPARHQVWRQKVLRRNLSAFTRQTRQGADGGRRNPHHAGGQLPQPECRIWFFPAGA